MKKLLLSLAGIVILTGLFLTASAMFQTNRNVLRTINNGADLTKKPEDKNKLNILLVGYGDENWEGVGFDADSLIVVSMDMDTNEITFNSLPLYTFSRTAEDLIDNAKIAAYTNYGFYIDHYATMNFAAFKEAIDILGGIDVYVDESINDTQFPNDVSFSNGKIQLNRDPSRGYAPFNISAGKHHMDGETALKYVRSKKTTSEEDRQHRQQKVLQAALDKILTSGFDISQLYNLYKIYNNKIITDISLSDATSIISVLRGSKVDSQKNTTDSTLGGNQVNSQKNTDSSLGGNYTKNTNNSNYSEGNKNESTVKSYTTEQKNAYNFAKTNGITSANDISSAKMESPLTRIQMAKMLSYYAINILGKNPDTSKTPNFDDVSSQLNAQYNNAVVLAYQLGIMGQNAKNNKFRPNDVVTRAEFATALSRMLYGMEDGKGNTKYYETHISKLYNEGIINKSDPKIKEKRGYVMIMLMRSAE